MHYSCVNFFCRIYTKSLIYISQGANSIVHLSNSDVMAKLSQTKKKRRCERASWYFGEVREPFFTLRGMDKDELLKTRRVKRNLCTRQMGHLSASMCAVTGTQEALWTDEAGYAATWLQALVAAQRKNTRVKIRIKQSY